MGASRGHHTAHERAEASTDANLARERNMAQGAKGKPIEPSRHRAEGSGALRESCSPYPAASLMAPPSVRLDQGQPPPLLFPLFLTSRPSRKYCGEAWLSCLLGFCHSFSLPALTLFFSPSFLSSLFTRFSPLLLASFPPYPLSPSPICSAHRTSLAPSQPRSGTVLSSLCPLRSYSLSVASSGNTTSLPCVYRATLGKWGRGRRQCRMYVTTSHHRPSPHSLPPLSLFSCVFASPLPARSFPLPRLSSLTHSLLHCTLSSRSARSFPSPLFPAGLSLAPAPSSFPPFRLPCLSSSPSAPPHSYPPPRAPRPITRLRPALGAHYVFTHVAVRGRALVTSTRSQVTSCLSECIVSVSSHRVMHVSQGEGERRSQSDRSISQYVQIGSRRDRERESDRREI
ncbi:hypothetical protein C7M84_005993 [Penaeus vannamei]|uniref:Uncharacterized protein n=1 Tax=Penaeus vannamei TaxID=6689 RepID=A0A423TG81_PENVA|nr:hypothetical protein C7M84_005993 [Penaeus vannamei]